MPAKLLLHFGATQAIGFNMRFQLVAHGLLNSLISDLMLAQQTFVTPSETVGTAMVAKRLISGDVHDGDHRCRDRSN